MLVSLWTIQFAKIAQYDDDGNLFQAYVTNKNVYMIDSKW